VAAVVEAVAVAADAIVINPESVGLYSNCVSA